MIRGTVRFTQRATWVFDPEDAYARGLGFAGSHPRPADRLEFELVARVVGTTAEPLPEVAKLRTVLNGSGYYLFFGELRPEAPSDRRARAANKIVLTPGAYRVRVVSERYQPFAVDMLLPADPKVPKTFDLLPGYAYPFPTGRQPSGLNGPTLVRGAVLNPDGSGTADRTVEVLVGGAVAAVYTTDGNGQWVLPVPDPLPNPSRPAAALPPKVVVQLRVRDAAGAVLFQGPREIEYGKSNAVRVARAAGAVRTRAGVPVADVRLETAGFAGTSRSRADGRWVFVFPPGAPAAGPLAFTATHPDGRTATAVAAVAPETETTGPDFEF